jgi:tetratricopeptide (TPR) repeat protein
MRDALEGLREATVFIRSPDGSTGSGYLIAPRRIGTALHVVKACLDGATCEVLIGAGINRLRCQAKVLQCDAAADAAVLGFDEMGDFKPLPVARSLDRKAAWIGYGFPALASKPNVEPNGLVLDGHVQDPNAPVGNRHSAVLLYSQMIAAGNASPLHGFSGSPVTVDGALIGHLVRHIGDPNDRLRAAFGYVYACPIDAVVRLLEPGLAPKPREISPRAVQTLADAIPAIGPDEYHVFVSYSSTDRAWALTLVDRLEGAGLRVFFDHRSLEPGDYLAGQLQSTLQRSRAAVLLVSSSWIESGWCQQEASVLVKRAVEDKRFGLVPLRLDDCRMPVFLDARLWLNFNGTAHAQGPELDRLLNVLLGRSGPQPDPIAAQAEAAARKVSDEYVARVRDAAVGHSSRIEQLLEEWRKTAPSDVAPVIAAAEVLIGKGEFGRAQRALEGLAPSLRVRQLRAFALSKCGRDEAIELLEALVREGHDDAETMGLLAGSFKRRWRRTADRGFARRCYEVYGEAFTRWKDSFNGINTASMALHCGERARMVECAVRVVDLLKDRPLVSLDHWERASLGEGYLLLERFETAREWYARAVGRAAGRHQDIAMMRRQARLDLVALGQAADKLDDVLSVPRVLAYFGHMVDAPDRKEPRFPSERVPRVRLAIRERLAHYGALHGFGCAAGGSDLLFLEELVENGRTATVVLPFPVPGFVSTSVGEAWRDSFEATLGAPGVTVVEPLLPERPDDAEIPRTLAAANREIMRRAVEYARALDEKPIACAVWDGQSGDGPGGTAEAAALWRNKGFDVELIDPLRA